MQRLSFDDMIGDDSGNVSDLSSNSSNLLHVSA